MEAVLAQTSPQLLLKELHQRLQQQPSSSIGCFGSSFQCQPLGGKELRRVGRGRRGAEIRSFWDVSKPTPVEMEAINDTEQLDDILQRAQGDGTSNSVVIDWMAAWCRKCIYLKPKLEKLAADFPKVKFYYVDVNKVSQALVKRGNISKMPTIQLWKDGEMREEVIGGHKAWLVVEEVKEMIQKYN